MLLLQLLSQYSCLLTACIETCMPTMQVPLNPVSAADACCQLVMSKAFKTLMPLIKHALGKVAVDMAWH